MCTNQLWFKVSVGIFNDPKIKIIKSKKKGYFIICCFFQCMCLAGMVNDGGLIYVNKNIPYTMEMLAVEFGSSIKDAEYAVNILAELEMIEFTEEGYLNVTNWAKYQNVEALENLRNRVAKSRAKKKVENEAAADEKSENEVQEAENKEKAVNKNTTRKKRGRKKKETITEENKDCTHIENPIESKADSNAHDVEDVNNKNSFNTETVNNIEAVVDNSIDNNINKSTDEIKSLNNIENAESINKSYEESKDKFNDESINKSNEESKDKFNNESINKSNDESINKSDNENINSYNDKSMNAHNEEVVGNCAYINVNDDLNNNSNVTCNKENVTVTNCNTNVTPKIKNKIKNKNKTKIKTKTERETENNNADKNKKIPMVVHFSDEIEIKEGDKVVKEFCFNDSDNSAAEGSNKNSTIPAYAPKDASLTINPDKLSSNRAEGISGSRTEAFSNSGSSGKSLGSSLDKLSGSSAESFLGSRASNEDKILDSRAEDISSSNAAEFLNNGEGIGSNAENLLIREMAEYKKIDSEQSDAAVRLINYYESLTGYMGGIDFGQMKLFIKMHGESIVKKAIEKAVENGKKDRRYINGILMNWRKEGYPQDTEGVRNNGGKSKCNSKSDEADTGFKVPKRRKLSEEEKRRLDELYAND